MSLIRNISESARRLITSPENELDRWQRAVRFAIDLSRYCFKQLMRDRASEMAAALTYRTIFGLIPMLVMALVVFNAFEGFEKIGDDAIDTILSQMNLDIGNEMIEGEPSAPLLDDATGQPIEPGEAADDAAPPPDDATEIEPTAADVGEGEGDRPAAGSVGATSPDDPSQQQFRLEMRANIKATIDGLLEKIKNIDFTSIGLAGLALLIWAAISLVITVERSFNRIYNSNSGRGWHQRILLYWSVLTLGPLLLMISIYAATQLMQGGAEIAVVGPLVQGLSRFTSFAASWLLLLLLYVLMPNARVHLRPAAIGSFVGALLWELAKGGFRLYVGNAVGLEAIYGTLALLPLFLLWMYLTWFIVLFGLELTYTLQTMRGRQLEEQAKETDDRRLIDLKLAVPLAATIAQRFREGAICETGDLASTLNVPGYVAERLLQALRSKGLIHPVEQDKSTGYALARPAEVITVAHVLDAAHEAAVDDERAHAGPGWDCLERIRLADERTDRTDQPCGTNLRRFDRRRVGGQSPPPRRRAGCPRAIDRFAYARSTFVSIVPIIRAVTSAMLPRTFRGRPDGNPSQQSHARC